MKTTIENYKVITKFPVQWGEMDAAKHVNNLIYLRWAESGRIEYFKTIKMDVAFDGSAVGPILGWQDCKYIFPMTYPDTAIVGTKVIECLPDRFIMESAIFSEKHERVAAISKQHIIPYDYSELKKVAIPKLWLEAIKELDG